MRVSTGTRSSTTTCERCGLGWPARYLSREGWCWPCSRYPEQWADWSVGAVIALFNGSAGQLRLNIGETWHDLRLTADGFYELDTTDGHTYRPTSTFHALHDAAWALITRSLGVSPIPQPRHPRESLSDSRKGPL